jgi:hypothetical protein
MKNMKCIQATVVSTRTLNQDDKDLLEEIKALRIASLKNLTDSFRQLLTLSTAVIGLQVAILKLPDNPVLKTWNLFKVLTAISLACLFISTLLASIGQLSNRMDFSTLNLLKFYRQRRDELIRRGYQLYEITSFLFVLGLAIFMLNIVFLFVW